MNLYARSVKVPVIKFINPNGESKKQFLVPSVVPQERLTGLEMQLDLTPRDLSNTG